MDDRLTTAEVARALKMSEDWVREHAPELGGVRMGGARGPLRFLPERIERYEQQQALSPPPAPARKPHRPGRRRAPRGVQLVALPADR